MKSLYVIFVVVAIIIGVTGAVGAFIRYGATQVAVTPSPSPLPSLSPVACSMEAKLCPDGSYVARTGPNCEFTQCPPATPSPAPIGSQGIQGTVLLGPICPVMQNPPDPQCQDKLYQTTLLVTNKDQSKVITVFQSDVKGAFVVNLPPGQYYIISDNTAKPLPRCSSDGVITVSKGSYVTITVSCDSGIR